MSIVDTLGRRITLCGTHAFEWSIAITTDNNITIIQLQNRQLATKEFNKYKKKR